MLKTRFQIKYSLILTLVWLLSIITVDFAGATAKIISLDGVQGLASRDQNFLTMEESLEKLVIASGTLKNVAEGSTAPIHLETAKQALLNEISSIGSHQFPQGVASAYFIDSVLTRLLNVYPYDTQTVAAVDSKLVELSKNIFNTETKHQFLMALYEKLKFVTRNISQENVVRVLSLYENLPVHFNQTVGLIEIYMAAQTKELKLRSFNQIYQVLIDPNIEFETSLQRANHILRGLVALVTGSEVFSIKEFEKINEIFNRVSRDAEYDIMRSQYIMSLLKIINSKNIPSEISYVFEKKVLAKIVTNADFNSVIEFRMRNLVDNDNMTEGLARVLEQVKIKKVNYEREKQLRAEQRERTNILNFPGRKRAAPTCHSVYGL